MSSILARRHHSLSEFAKVISVVNRIPPSVCQIWQIGQQKPESEYRIGNLIGLKIYPNDHIVTSSLERH